MKFQTFYFFFNEINIYINSNSKFNKTLFLFEIQI